MKKILLLSLLLLNIKAMPVYSQGSSISFELNESSIFSYGQNITLGAQVHKGNTSKRLVQFFIEDSGKKTISNITKIYVSKKNSSIMAEIAITLKNPCSIIEEKDYFIVAEGIDITARKKINFYGFVDFCANMKDFKIDVPNFDKSKNKTKFSNAIQYQKDMPKTASQITNLVLRQDIDDLLELKGEYELIYESSSSKSKNMAFYFIVFTLLAVIFLLLFKE